MKNNIYLSRPINKTAALVVGQSDAPSVSQDEQMRQNLVARLKMIEAKLPHVPKKSQERKNLGQEKFELQEKINAIRPTLRCQGVEQFFIDSARDILTKFQFDRIMGIAADRLRAAKLEIDRDSN